MSGNGITVLSRAFLAFISLNSFTLSAAEKAEPLTTFAQWPIKERTVFKDGHAFVAHEGRLPTDDQANVKMDSLPSPVFGTFWPSPAEPQARLGSVISSRKRVLVER